MGPNKTEADFPAAENLEAAFTPGRFACLLLLLIAASFPALVTGSGTFFCRDFGLFTYPVTHWQQASWLRGEVPLWDPLNCCGIPFLAQWNTAVLYPPAWLCLMFPLSWSLGILFLGHLFLAGMGMYFLARRWTGGNFAAAAAGTAFTFSAVLLNCLLWTSNLAAMAWMPWVVLCVERAWTEGGRQTVIAALVATIQMLAGAPELILLTWLLLAALLLEFFCTSANPFRWRTVGRFVMVVMLVGGLSAAQLLPFADLLAHSNRDANYTADDWSMPGWGLANFLIPLYRSCPTVFGIYTQPGQFWIFSYYPGIGAVTLALLACWRSRRTRVWLLALLTVLCLMLALGDNGFFYASLRRVLPQLSLMRYPIKFIALPALLIPLLAAFAIKSFMPGTENQIPVRRRALILFLLLAAVISWLIWTVHQHPATYASWHVTAQSGLTRLGFLFLILGLFVACGHIKRPRAQVIVCLGILLLFWLDAMTNGPRPNPAAPRWIYQPNLARNEAHFGTPPELGQSRLMVSGEAGQSLRFSTLTNPAENYVYSRLAMFDDCNLLDGIPKVDGFFSLYGREQVAVLNTLYGTNQPAAGLLDFLAVSQLTSPGKNIEWQYRPTHLPWITAGQKPVFAGPEKTLAAMATPGFDPRTTVYLPLASAGSLGITNVSTPQILSSQFSSQKIELQIQATEPAMVVVAQTFYHCWQAYLDGQPVQILRANYAFEAVAIPAGTHQLEFAYEDWMFRAGAAVSLVTLAGCVGVWFWKPRRINANSSSS
jgi:hypothetical protein